MMILRSSPASPFGRKVRIAAALLGLTEEIEIVAADTNDPGESLRLQNPLGKNFRFSSRKIKRRSSTAASSSNIWINAPAATN